MVKQFPIRMQLRLYSRKGKRTILRKWRNLYLPRICEMTFAKLSPESDLYLGRLNTNYTSENQWKLLHLSLYKIISYIQKIIDPRSSTMMVLEMIDNRHIYELDPNEPHENAGKCHVWVWSITSEESKILYDTFYNTRTNDWENKDILWTLGQDELEQMTFDDFDWVEWEYQYYRPFLLKQS